MCGVAGYISSLKQTKNKNGLNNVLNIMKHRGPDGNGIYESKNHNVALVHTRLAIIDLSKSANQPMHTLDKKIVLSFNGEIYNYLELRNELIAEGVKFRTYSDTEVILELYSKYRNIKNFEKIFLNRLDGIFAFAIWDEDLKKMMIVRDSMGVKPMYYQLKNGLLSFASEIKALLNFAPYKNYKNSIKNFSDTETKPIDSRIDLGAISKYITFLWCPGNSTPLKDIKKLGPGEFLTFNLNKKVINEKYYQIKKSKSKLKNKSISNDLEYNQNILSTAKLLENAVKKQMVSDVPVGAFLSGGLDSSAIVAFASKINPNIECFTINTGDNQSEGFVNDYPYAVQVAKYLGVKLNSVDITPKDIINNISKMVEILDEPLADPAALNIFFISGIARQAGIKVLLSGTGGDDVFSGYRRHLAVKYNSYISSIPKPIKNFIQSCLKRIPANNPNVRRIKKLFDNHSTDTQQFLCNCFKWINQNSLEKLYTPEMLHFTNSEEIDAPMLHFQNEIGNDLSDLQKCLALERQFFLSDHNLIYTDKMSMAQGVEVRVPFLDKELINFSCQLDDDLLIRGNKLKWILKKSMEPYLPQNIINRPKTGFGMPLRKWLKTDLREFVYDTLNESTLIKRGMFDSKAVKKLIVSNDKGIEDTSYIIFSLLCIELWCQKYL